MLNLIVFTNQSHLVTHLWGKKRFVQETFYKAQGSDLEISDSNFYFLGWLCEYPMSSCIYTILIK